MTAELEARRTAATAVLADFKAAVDDFVRGTSGDEPPAYVDWAFRLSSELQSLLGCTDPGGVYLTPDDLATVLAALGDATEGHEYRASLTCADCQIHPAELCDDHGAGLDAAAAYRHLTARLEDKQ